MNFFCSSKNSALGSTPSSGFTWGIRVLVRLAATATTVLWLQPARAENQPSSGDDIGLIGINDNRTPEQKIDDLNQANNRIREIFDYGADSSIGRFVGPFIGRGISKRIIDQTTAVRPSLNVTDPGTAALQETFDNNGVIDAPRLRALMCESSPANPSCTEPPRRAEFASCRAGVAFTCKLVDITVSSLVQNPLQNYGIICSENDIIIDRDSSKPASTVILFRYKCVVSGNSIVARLVGHLRRDSKTFEGIAYAAPCVPCR